MLTQLQQDNKIYLPGYPEIEDAKLITQLQGNGNYTVVHLLNKPKTLLISQTLKRFESQLPTFIRISKSALINPVYVERVIKVDTRTVYIKLGDGTRLLVSRRRLTDTLARLDIVLQGVGVATVDRVRNGRFKISKPVQTRSGALKPGW